MKLVETAPIKLGTVFAIYKLDEQGEVIPNVPEASEEVSEGEAGAEQWAEVEQLPQKYEVAWTAEARMIPTNASVEWEVDWEWLYGTLPAGNYRIGKTFINLRENGDMDLHEYYAEFDIVE